MDAVKHSYSNNDAKEEEIDWIAILKHEPAKTEVPIYLDARNRCKVASEKFKTAIQDYRRIVKDKIEELICVMVDMYNERSS